MVVYWQTTQAGVKSSSKNLQSLVQIRHYTSIEKKYLEVYCTAQYGWLADRSALFFPAIYTEGNCPVNFLKSLTK